MREREGVHISHGSSFCSMRIARLCGLRPSDLKGSHDDRFWEQFEFKSRWICQ